jgi:putative acyl-CoA dehydrogenase
MKTFKQTPPQLPNLFTSDTTLQNIVDACVNDIHKRNLVTAELERFGALVVSKEVLDQQNAAEQQENRPRLRQYDAWQNRVDELELHESWRYFHDFSAREWLVGAAYGINREKLGPAARILQFCKLYMFDSSSAVYTCPLAMTDGAARLLELQLLKNEKEYHLEPSRARLYREILDHLTTNNPSQFWTSGQWMTEKIGGSDVRNTETIAVPIIEDGVHRKGAYRLSGFKWFTSATDSQITLALAKIQGSDSLSLFLVKIRDENGNLNGIKIHKLKDKLGTRALPTAELSLNNTEALLVGEPGEGVQTISCMLNITRIYNSVCASGAMRRIIAYIQDYSSKRRVFGKLLREHNLYNHWLAKIVAEQIGCLHLTMDVVHLLGKSECGVASSTDKDILRLLTPIAKLYTGKRCVQVISEGIEMIGGQGYIEDTGIPRILRNAQVLPIWEGTTIVLSLDVLRVLTKNSKSLLSWKNRVLQIVENANKQQSGGCTVTAISSIQDALAHIFNHIGKIPKFDADSKLRAELYAREFAFSIAQTHIASLLLQFGNNHVLEQFLLDHKPLAPIEGALEVSITADTNRERIVSRL